MIGLGLLRRVGPIGIDLGGPNPTACQFARGRGRRVAAALELTRTAESPLEEIPRLARVLARRGFTSAPLIVAVADSETTVAELALPLAERSAPVGDIVSAQLGKLRQSASASLDACWWPTQNIVVNGSTRSLAVAIPTELGDKIATSFESEGLVVAAIEPRPVAFARACRPVVRFGLEVIVEVEPNSAQMIVIEGGIVSYVRPLTWRQGLTQRGSVAAEAMSLDAFLADLRLSLGYLGHRHPNVAVDRVLLVGASGSDAGVGEAIRSSLELEPIVVQPAELGARSEIIAGLGPSMLAAFGLAAREEDE